MKAWKVEEKKEKQDERQSNWKKLRITEKNKNEWKQRKRNRRKGAYLTHCRKHTHFVFRHEHNCKVTDFHGRDSRGVTLCSLKEVYRRFEGKYCVHLRVRRVSRATNKQAASRARHRTSTTSVRFYETIRSNIPEDSTLQETILSFSQTNWMNRWLDG